ncbi:MAG: hypothetical protein E6641_06580 [Bacteroides faecis]|nr:hypothetical protein [Bacteroides faecis]
MKDNILSLPNDVLGDIFREIYSEYEKSIRSIPGFLMKNVSLNGQIF